MKFVINYDFPGNIEDYVHRIGRTGRSNNKGTSYTFFTQSNGAKVDELVNILQETNQVILINLLPSDTFTDIHFNPRQQYVNPELYQLKRFGGGNRRGGGRNNYNSQHGTFKKGSFGQKPGGYGGGRPYENGGGFKKSFDNGAGAGGGSRFSDRKFEGGEGSRNGHTFANGHTRFN